MEDYHEESARSLAITIAFAIYTVVLYGVTYCVDLINDQPVVRIILLTVLDILSFTIIYKIINMFYDSIGFKYVNKIDNLTGDWFVLHIPKTMNLSEYRFGEANISQKYFRVFIDAKNYGTEINIQTNSDRVNVTRFLENLHHDIDNIIKKFNEESNHDAESRFRCIDDIDSLIRNAAESNVSIKINKLARSTTWRYEIGRIDPDRSVLFALFKAHSDKPIAETRTLCEKCADTIKQCAHCHDYKTEIDNIEQDSNRYGGHMIKIEHDRTEKKLFKISRAKKVVEVNGEYHNMLPNHTGEGKICFIRQCGEVIDSRNIPIEILDRLKELCKLEKFYHRKTTKERSLNESIYILHDQLKNSMEDGSGSGVHKVKATKEAVASEQAKLVATDKLIEYVKDGIRFELNKYKSRAILNMQTTDKKLRCDLYDKNKIPVGRIIDVNADTSEHYRLFVELHIFNKEGKTILLRKKGSSSIDWVKGPVLTKESNHDAASRILHETTGIEKKFNESFIVSTDIQDHRIIDHYACLIEAGDSIVDSLEIISVDEPDCMSMQSKGEIPIDASLIGELFKFVKKYLEADCA